MAEGDVVTRSKNGQWVNIIEGQTERSRSFSSREEAVRAGAEYADDHGTVHCVIDSAPTGTITDGGAPGEEPVVVDDARRVSADDTRRPRDTMEE